jgi:hypothetical protein
MSDLITQVGSRQSDYKQKEEVYRVQNRLAEADMQA